MTRTEVLEAIREVLRDQCAVEREVLPESVALQAELGLDSVGLLNLALEVENRFELFLDEAPDQPPETLGALADLVVARLEEQGQS